MESVELGGQEAHEQLIKDINQITLKEVAECQVCGEKLREGDGLVAFAFRPADQPAFQFGHTKCTDCRHEPTEYFTLGVRELVVDGRVGRCSDQATQSSRLVLLAPQPRAVSPVETTTVHPLPGTTWFRRPITRSDVYKAADHETARKPWQRPVIRTDTTPDNTPDADAETDTTTTDAVESTPDTPTGGPGGAR